MEEFRNHPDGGHWKYSDKDPCYFTEEDKKSPMNYWDSETNAQHLKNDVFQVIANKLREGDETGFFDGLQLISAPPAFRVNYRVAGTAPHLDFYRHDNSFGNKKGGVWQFDRNWHIRPSELTAEDWTLKPWPNSYAQAKYILNIWFALDPGKSMRFASEQDVKFKSHDFVDATNKTEPQAWANGNHPTNATFLTKENYKRFILHAKEAPPGTVLIFISQSDDDKVNRAVHEAFYPDNTNRDTPSVESRAYVPMDNRYFLW